jgi:hypothetical protein
MQITTEPLSKTFPEGFFAWAGHRDGGVKKPFRRETGRPAGIRINTPLMIRLREWAKRFSNGEKVAASILLVGGPGNGKTDAVEGLVEDLDEILNLGGKLFEAFGTQYAGPNADNPPRRVEVDLGSLLSSPPDHLKRRISIVQDATEADPTRRPGLSAQDLLLEEFEELANGAGDDIYICCVNRGKLAEACTAAVARNTNESTMSLLAQVTRAVTSSPEADSCWPLRNFPSIVAWPMDIDSLVEVQGQKQAAIHQILEPALEANKWPSGTECAAGEMCPFCTNRKILSQAGAVDHLADLLRAFELGTGKRWTFRDLYSLISYMLVGDEEELVVDGKRLAPCDWAAVQVELLASTRKVDEARRSRALFSLVGALYWHRLFPLWPKLTAKEFTNARNKIIKTLTGDLSYLNDLFRYLGWPGRNRTSGSIARLVAGTFCPLLDPADCAPEQIISKAATNDYTAGEIDDYFSLSVGQGLGILRRRIPPLERELLKRLEAADEALGTDLVSSQDRSKAELLQSCIRRFSSRLMKRSLGTQSGVYANRDSLQYYKKALSDPGTLRQIQNELKGLLNDQERNLFVIPLMTTFAQPTPPRRRNVSLETTVVKVLPWKSCEAERPKPQLVYLKVDDTPVPLTFGLFNALQELGRGMHPGSLDDEVFAMVDRIRAKVAGHVVRNEERLLDDAVIVIESTGEKIRFTGDEYVVDQRNE